ncbi:MAG TPA: molybdopterin-dependent oxidoreductase [Candidatus Limnocylindria bacterium]|jgi:DMSO/TMAO reductase YedYZ molybdopterin-dependent catalytic subunit|nr:molybdopterin-dependent oxidoreductase [Candidatus Limnocylindria bacterium]
MKPWELSRRDFMRGSVGLAAYTLASHPLAATAMEAIGEEEVIPFLEAQPIGKMLQWQKLTRWVTPTEDVYEVKHYGRPTSKPDPWQVEFTGYLKKPHLFTVPELQKRKHKSLYATLECGGNGSSKNFMGAIGNVKWTGTPLGPILRELGLGNRSREVVFYGADEKIEKIRDNDYPQHFARSLPLEHALEDDVLLAWAMNDEPLNEMHGAPVRLIVPGWFGIAWVKWLTRVDVLDRRFMGRWMAREYVTIRGEDRPGSQMNWRETSVCNIDVKSIAARVVKTGPGRYRVSGAAWSDGTPITKVELKIDDGSWAPVTVEKKPVASKYTWCFWHYDWVNPAPGEHSLVSRATDADGRVQPASEDSEIKNKRTYWESNQQWPQRVRLG